MIYRPILSSSMIDRNETRRYAGAAKARKIDDALIDEAIDEVMVIAEPIASIERHDYNCMTQRVNVSDEESFLIEGRAIGIHLAGCEEVILIAVTLGNGVDDAVTKSFDYGRYAHGVMLDAAATAAVEAAADETEKIIRASIEKENYKMRWRYSPGYGDWPITAQQAMVRLTKANKIGITLTDKLMLNPQKSITAVIGLAHGEIERDIKKGCAGCMKSDCPLRRG